MKKKLPRGMLGPKMEEVKEVWRKLHNKQLSTLHSSLNIIKVITCGMMI
jgi:sulfite reductase beta subunit-like hemoprotein